jgi:sortase (surface protein transpeptidase)
MKLIMNFEVSKGYETWKKAFLDNEPMRQRHNINLLAYGHADDNENNVYSVIEIPAMEVMQDMLKDPDMVTLRENAGVILETQSMIKLVE